MVEEWQSEQVRSFLLVWCPSRYYGVCKESSRNKRLYQSLGYVMNKKSAYILHIGSYFKLFCLLCPISVFLWDNCIF